jgi:maltooligosyltrehalose trehalohydrolase
MVPALGVEIEPDSVVFRAYSTRARRMSVVLYNPAGNVLWEEPMEPRGDGLHEACLYNVRPGALYKLRVDDQELPDPYARFLPQGVHGPAMVVEPGYAFRFPPRRLPLSANQILYEIHVGAFTDEGTYAAAAARLPELVELGVTTLELMPLSAFPGKRGWGYDGVAPFAPHAAYGTPSDLCAFIDRAHELGLSVILDVVYNHLGPDGNYLSAYSPEYFTDRHVTPWGNAPDFSNPYMRRLVLDSARHWLDDFRFDGLRLDATHEIFDDTSRHILTELSDVVRAMPGPPILIAENDRNDPEVVLGHGLDAQWADDFHHVIHVLLTGEKDGYYAAYQGTVEELARTVENGWLYTGQISPATGKPRGRPRGALGLHQLVYALQNHDQVGNRAYGDRLAALAGEDAYRAALALLLFLPATPLLFMGDEWGSKTPFLYFTDHVPELGAKVSAGRRDEFRAFAAFADPAARADIPDPQEEPTFRRSVITRKERSEGKGSPTMAFCRKLIALRRSDPVLRDGTGSLSARARGSVLHVLREQGSESRTLIVNFGGEPVHPEIHGSPRLVVATPGSSLAGVLPRGAVLLSSS